MATHDAFESPIVKGRFVCPMHHTSKEYNMLNKGTSGLIITFYFIFSKRLVFHTSESIGKNEGHENPRNIRVHLEECSEYEGSFKTQQRKAKRSEC